MPAGSRFRPSLPPDQPPYLIQRGEHISRKHFRPHSVSFRRSLETIDNESHRPWALPCDTADFSSSASRADCGDRRKPDASAGAIRSAKAKRETFPGEIDDFK